MIRRFTLMACLLLAPLMAAAQSADALRIYLVDVEGGNATLFVSPAGESLLIDTGNGGANADRDVGRVAGTDEESVKSGVSTGELATATVQIDK